MSSLFRSIISILSGKLIGRVIGLIFTPILVRIISQSQYGLYASILAGFNIIALVFKGGLFDATRKIVAEHATQTKEVSSIALSSLFVASIYSLLAILSMFIILRLQIIPPTYSRHVWVLLCSILFINVLTSVRGLFYGLRLESIGEILYLIRKVTYFISASILVYSGSGIIGVFVGYVISFICSAIMGIITLFNYSIHNIPRRQDIIYYNKEIASFGGYQLIGGLSAVLLYRIDVLLIEFFRGSGSTGLYQSAIISAEIIWFLPYAIQLAFLQHTANLWGEQKIDQINDNIQSGIKYAILSLTIFGVGLFGLAKPFLGLYFGPEYVGAATTLRLLILGTVSMGVVRVIIPVLETIGWIRYTAFVAVGAVTINIPLNMILIPQYGITGASVGTAMSYVFLSVGIIYIYYYSRLDSVSLSWIIRIVRSQVIFAVLFLTVVRLSTFSSLISLIVLSPFGLALFLSINIIDGHITPNSFKSFLS
jgi:O-antigen/teichoic acid export membrane protein